LLQFRREVSLARIAPSFTDVVLFLTTAFWHCSLVDLGNCSTLGVIFGASIYGAKPPVATSVAQVASTLMSMDEVTVDSLYAAVELAVADNHSWDAQLGFKLTSGVFQTDQFPHVHSLPVNEQDLFDLGAASHLKGLKYYFDPVEFPFDGNFKTSKASWSELTRRLCRSAANNGYSLQSKGVVSPDKKLLFCTRGSLYEGSASKSTCPSDYRSSYLKSDKRAGARPEGRDLPRRATTSRPTCKAERCGVRLLFGVDTSGYFVYGGRGCKKHTHHPRLYTDVVPVSVRLLSVTEKENIHHYVKAGLPCSRAALLIGATSNLLVKRTAARFLSETLEDWEPAGVSHTPAKYSTTDKLFAILQNERHDHIVLSSNGTSHANPGVQTSNFVASATLVTSEQPPSSLPASERVLMDAYVTKHRLSRQVADERDMFLAVVWMTAPERSLFRKFPYVVKLDVTFKTNSRGIPFLTFTGKTSDNEIYTILRCFVPNEQGWIFRWLLLTALPTILGKDIARIQMVISDGDSQEITQINNLIESLMTQARRQRCAWHVVDRSWDRYVYKVPKAGTKKLRSRATYAETLRKFLFQWMYSWMTKACETKDEYEASKALFVHYLSSDHIHKKLGQEMVESVQAMYTKAVYPHETNFVFHIRQKLFAFEEFTNTTQEASFAAVKHGPSAVTGSMDIHTSVSHLNRQAATKSVAYQASALSRLSSTATWSTISSVVSKMVPYGGGLIEKEWNQSHNAYISGMFGPAEFRLSLLSDGDADGDADGEVENVNVCDVNIRSAFVPRFKYLRIVKVVTRGTACFLVCSCGHFERCGIPCRHLFHVRRKYWKNSYPLATDIHPMWHAHHKAYAFTVDTHGRRLHASAALELFAKEFPNCVVGLRIPTAVPDNPEPVLHAHPDLEVLSAADRCVNWPSELIRDLVTKQKSSGIPATSQQVNMYSQASENSGESEHSGHMPDLEARFANDTVAFQKQNEENLDVKNALIPLTKELLIAVEKAPHSLKDTCVALREMIANLNVKDDDELNGNPTGPMVLPTSKKRKTRGH
jgi:hypothetical protein